MTTVKEQDPAVTLKKELKLQVNQNLYEKGIISKEVYELAKIKIVNGT